MRINRNLFSIKSHFFLYWGFMASAPPFVMVIARQVGVPLGVQGVVSSVITVTAVLVRPFIAALADTYPAQRKIIFLALIIIMTATYNPIGFLPPLQPSPHLSGQLMSISFPATNLITNNSRTSLHLFTPRQQQHPLGECVVIDAWDCFAFCQNGDPCPVLTYHNSGFKVSLQPSHGGLIAEKKENITTLFPMPTSETIKIRHSQEVTPGFNVKDWQSSPNHTWQREKNKDMAYGTLNLKENQTMVYITKGLEGWPSKKEFNVSIECQGGVYGKEDGDKEICRPVLLSQFTFWIYVVFLLLAYITATTVESISDAVCCDTIGEGESYGQQRVWGVLSYGLLGVLSGLLVDWSSGDSTVKDYRPAFFLMTACGALDFLLSAACLKVPKLEAQQKGMRANLGPLLRQIHFFIFLGTTFLIGFFDGLDTGFLFVLQEDIAERMGTSGQHVNMVQGLTLLVQALSAIPCMFLCDWFLQRYGAQKVITTVLFLYSLRLLSLAAASHLGILWMTALVEMINGPCFGLGYTAIVVHASSLAPRGYSTTVQSVVGVCYGTLGYAGASFVGGAMYDVMGGEWLYLVTGAAAFFTAALHFLYITIFPSVTETPDIKTEERGCEKDLEYPQGMVQLDILSIHLERKGETAGEEMVEKDEEEIETLLDNVMSEAPMRKEEK